MKYFFLICVLFNLLASCESQNNRTEEEMLKAAYKVYKDYLFEYGIDESLFLPPVIEIRQNGNKSYKWFAMRPESTPVGVEVVVSKMKEKKPEMILIGDFYAWLSFLNDQDMKNKEK